MDKKIIIPIVVIVIIIVVGIGIFFNPTENHVDKKTSRITITSNSTLNVGDNITVKLTDVKGKPIKNETVNITIFGKDGSKSFNSVITNRDGIGTLSLEKSAGKYTNNATFAGNELYSGNSTSQKFTIGEAQSEEVDA